MRKKKESKIMPARCPFSGLEPVEIKTLSSIGEKIYEFDTPRAGGKYRILGSPFDKLTPDKNLLIFTEIQSLDSKGKARLITLLIDQRRFGEENPILDYDLIERARIKRNLSRQERAIRLLQYCADQSQGESGKTIELNPRNDDIRSNVSAHIEAAVSPDLRSSRGEIEFFREYLSSKGWLGYAAGNSYDYVFVTMEGYFYLDNLTLEIDSNKIFVAMWFDDSMNDAYNKGFLPGIQEAGFEGIRVDTRIEQVKHTGKIDDLVIAEIRSSRAVVADFTQSGSEARGSVYYEAGFAHGLRIPVIFTCRKDCIDELHFDTRQYPHIVWGNPEELRETLSNRILALLGGGTGH